MDLAGRQRQGGVLADLRGVERVAVGKIAGRRGPSRARHVGVAQEGQQFAIRREHLLADHAARSVAQAVPLCLGHAGRKGRERLPERRGRGVVQRGDGGQRLVAAGQHDLRHRVAGREALSQQLHMLAQEARDVGQPRDEPAVVGHVAQRLGVAQVHQRAVEAGVAVERHAVGMRLGGGDEALQLELEDRAIDARRGRHLRQGDRRERLAPGAPAREPGRAAGGVDALQAVVVGRVAHAGGQLRELGQAPGPVVGRESREALVGVVHLQASLAGRAASLSAISASVSSRSAPSSTRRGARTRSWPWPTCCCTSLMSCTNFGTVSSVSSGRNQA